TRRADLQHGGILSGPGGGPGAPDLHAVGAAAGGPARLEPAAAGAARAPAAAAAALPRAAAAVRVPPGAAVRLRGSPKRTALPAGVVSGGGPPAGRREAASASARVPFRLLPAGHGHSAARVGAPRQDRRHGEHRSCDVVSSAAAGR